MIAALLLPLILALPAQAPEARPSAKADAAMAKARAEEMRELARGITMKSGDEKALELAPEPIYRFVDPTRSFSDGTVWAFGRDGRPEAVLTVSLEGRQGGKLHWLYEFTSLSTDRVRAVGPAGAARWPWAPEGPGIVLRAIPKADAPDADAPKRLRQMRELARRFRAYEFFEPKPGERPERYELRLLPQPVARYKDPASGLVDGGLFFLVYGQNPEIALVIEARAAGNAAPSWTYGVQRISAARSHVRLDDREIADMPRINDNDLTRPYAGFIRPIPEAVK
ncbi:MAG: hypothetical protein JWN86_3301 [Planctomycetota bacterium]|nr:hypothetical protein [Planctomycetota bacterium]